MHVGDTIFIFCLALIIFGPKKLPEIGRQIGKLMVEFRRASNEFKMQIEEELRASEEAERQKEINAATTMLPTPTPTAAASALAASGALAETSLSAPVIATPSTGLPVNHTFPSTLDSAAEPATPLAEHSFVEDAGFNPGLNTASNGLNAEIPASDVAFQSESAPETRLDAGEAEAEKVQAPVHHG